MTTAGFFATVFCLFFLDATIHRNGFGFITETGTNWGGVSLGLFALCGHYKINHPDFFDETRKHEFGHSLQNLFLGPFFIFVVAIPSAVRYWLAYYGRLEEDYYAIWFERTATDWGTKVINWIEGE